MTRYLDAAIAVGARLAARAETTPQGPSWIGDSIVGQTEADARVVRGPVGPDLYGGLAGIGWFLAHLGAATGDRATMTLARDALAVAATPSPEAVGTAGAGLYSGAAGVALAASEGGVALGDAELQRQGDTLAMALAGLVEAHGPPEALDLIEGSAGLLISLLALRGSPRGPPRRGLPSPGPATGGRGRRLGRVAAGPAAALRPGGTGPRASPGRSPRPAGRWASPPTGAPRGRPWTTSANGSRPSGAPGRTCAAMTGPRSPDGLAPGATARSASAPCGPGYGKWSRIRAPWPRRPPPCRARATWSFRRPWARGRATRPTSRSATAWAG
jgi:hypothetical protein